MKKSIQRMLTAGLVLVMAAAPVVGLNRSVSGQAEKVSAVYTEPMGIAEQLSYRVSGARGLVSLCDSSLPEYAEMQDAISSLIEAESVHEQFAANAKIEELYPALAETVSAEQAEQKEYYVNQLENAQRVISESSYEEAVENFEKNVLGSPPVRLLHGVLWCRLPESFS